MRAFLLTCLTVCAVAPAAWAQDSDAPRRRFDAIDRDHDGKLLVEDLPGALRDRFKPADLDGDGTITAKEWQQAVAENKIRLEARRPPAPQDVAGVELFELESPRLTRFWGRSMKIQAGVVVPPEPAAGESTPPGPLPVCYSIHGFGGSHRSAWRSGPRLREKMSTGEYPRMLYVFLNAQFPLGHHEFADSVNNGPWGQALTQEFIPALEARFGAAADPHGRFLTGHSSGGWCSLWLQVAYPEYFGGTWSTAPDAVDFRDFTGINIYDYENAYRDPSGETIQLVRGANGSWSRSIEEFVQRELARRDYGGQFASFDAVFSPRGEDGRPMPLFDRQSGQIDKDVARYWENYDIRLILRRRWQELGPRLAGKLHVYIGTQDTFRLEGASRLLAAELKELGSDAEFIFAEGRHHGNLGSPHPEHWPQGMQTHIHRSMWHLWQAQTASAPTAR